MSTVLPFTPRTRAIRGTGDQTVVYTVKEAAGLLRLSLGSTYALVRQGTIPAIKVGGRWVIPKTRFHSWLNGDDELDRTIAAYLADDDPPRNRSATRPGTGPRGGR